MWKYKDDIDKYTEQVYYTIRTYIKTNNNEFQNQQAGHT